MKNIFKIILFFFLVCLTASCATDSSIRGKSQYEKNKAIKATKSKTELRHGTEYLIDPKKVKEQAKKEMDIIEKAGPKETDFDEVRDDKRVFLVAEQLPSYETTPDDFANLNQNISLNFKGVDFRDAMQLLAVIADVNILVGEEVSGTVGLKIENVPWDVAFKTILDMKTLAHDMDAPNSIIRVHTPDKLKLQEQFKAEQEEIKKKKQLSTLEAKPIIAELFKLFYISPEQAKQTLEDLYTTQSVEGATMGNIRITVENTTRSIIVRGNKEELDVVDAVIRKIDIKTKQVLIEAFIVEATSDFQKALGSRIAAMQIQERGDETVTISGITGGGNAATTAAGVALGTAAGTIAANTITGGAAGIGILKQMGARALKLEIEALQSLGITNIISTPSVFTLNNQEAKITQGTQIAYQSTQEGATTTLFKEAALSLTVTPSIIGDGHVLLDIKVNNDSAVEVTGSDEPGIKTNEITTKLLIEHEDIVVIGGIKIHNTTDSTTKTPGIGNVPVVGNLFKGKTNKDKLDEMLVFLSARIID